MTDLSMFRGDDMTFALVLTDTDGDPLDLTGATEVTFTVADPIEKNLSDGVTITSAVGGAITVTVDAADTADWPDHTASSMYAVRVTNGGLVRTRARGAFRVVWTPTP